MTKEEKQLLLKDICARIPYNVTCKLSVKDVDVSITVKLDLGGLEHFMFGTMDVKPYLRPMSSMTEEEKYTYRQLGATFTSDGESIIFVYVEDFPTVIDWLNAHHFDFRNLIEKGLAIDCTNLDIY